MNIEIDIFHLMEWEPFLLEGTPLAINRVVVLMWLAAALCLGLLLWGASRAAVRPKGIGVVAEMAYGFVRDGIARDLIGPRGTSFAPLLASMFYFILFANLFEIIPLINFPVTSRMAIPAALAVLSWVVFVTVGLREHGLSYLKGVLFRPGVPKVIYLILTPIEALSTFLIRPLTLAIRLFANMLAGHVMLTVFFLFTQNLLVEGAIGAKPIGVATLAVAAILIVFEMLIIGIQAYILTVLTAFYISEALEGEEEVGEELYAPGSAEQEAAEAA